MWTLSPAFCKTALRCGHQSGDDVRNRRHHVLARPVPGADGIKRSASGRTGNHDLSPPQYPCLCTGTAGNRQSQQHPAGKVSGLRVVQSHGQQELEGARLHALSERFRATRVRAQKYLAVYFPFLTFCTEASYAAVLLVELRRSPLEK